MPRVRWLLAGMVASGVLVAMALGAANPPRGPAAPAAPGARPPAKQPPDVAQGDSSRVDLEVDPRYGLVVAPVMLNGVAGRLLLGTDTTHTVVGPDFAAKTGIDKTATLVPIMGGPPGAQAKVSRVGALKVGSAEFKDLNVQIAGLEQLAKFMEHPPDGVLGADCLLSMPITLDYGGKRLVFGRPSDLASRKEVPADTFAYHFRVQGTVDGEKIEFIVDTSNNVSLIVKSSWKGKTEQAQGLEWAVPQAVSFGGVSVDNPRFVLADKNVLGLDFFRRYVVTLDPQEKKAYLQTTGLAQAGPIQQPGQKPGPGTPGEPAPPATPAKPLSPAAEKQLGDLQGRLLSLQQEVAKVGLNVSEAQRKMLETLNMTADQAAEDIANNRFSNKLLRDYKATLVGFAQQLQAFDAKFLPLTRPVRTPEADAKPRFVALADQAFMQRKSLQDKIADLFEKVGDYKAAIAIYEAEIVALTERKRTTEVRAAKEKLAQACDKAHDFQRSLAIYRAVYDSVPANERARNLNLMFRLAFAYERVSDFRRALEIYQEAEKCLPPGRLVPGLAEKIAILKTKVPP